VDADIFKKKMMKMFGSCWHAAAAAAGYDHYS